MGKTSSEVKRRYNQKTYSAWTVYLHKEVAEHYAELKGDMSRAEWLKMLVDAYYKTENEE